MRITIGGLLVIAGVGAASVLGSLRFIDSGMLIEQTKSLKKSTAWIMSLVKGTSTEASALPPAEPIASAPVEDKPQSIVENQAAEAAPVAVSAVKSTQIVSVPLVANEKSPVPSSIVVPKDQYQQIRTRRRRLAKKRGQIAKASDPVASKKTGLMGTYVALKLKSGREVRGILQAKTPKQYTLELPGMGPFQYDAENVVSISPAE